jgi:hypothetical protein
MRLWLYFLGAVFYANAAQAFEMAMPVDCKMGSQCAVQNYVDHNPAKGDTAYTDFSCGYLSYDGHKGTDIRTLNLGIMRRGINILAVADGMVLGSRDGVEDGAPVVKDAECGNGVRVSHKAGWVTQYCHMKNGSVKVKKGDFVKTGDVLGQIGLSGNTVFPHVHVQVEKDGQIMDPYTNTTADRACAKTPSASLWNADAAKKLAYKPTGLLGAGFTNQKPEGDAFQQGLHRHKQLPAASPMLIFWVEFYGAQRGDEVYIALRNPDGMVLAEQKKIMDRNRAVQSLYVGKANKSGMLAAGDYSGVFTIRRAGELVLQREQKVDVTQ